MAAQASINPPLCANVSSGSQCTEPASLVCAQCHLVQYCSKNCQVAHWHTHKKETCKTDLMSKHWKPQWVQERRLPTFADGSEDPRVVCANRYLWGMMPALDLLNLPKNEGVQDLSRDYNILCAASGDLRNIIKTVAGLPDGYAGQFTAVINDKDFDVVARNIIFILIALYLPKEEAVPVIIHLWYSALIPTPMLTMLREKILPLIIHICTKIEHKAPNALQAKTLKHESGGSLRVVLSEEYWNVLCSYLQVDPHVTAADAKKLRNDEINNPKRTDMKHNGYYYQLPAFRMCMARFLDDGILLPYGTSRAGFDSPNPIYYQFYYPDGHFIWPMRDDAEPHQGWDHEDIMKGNLPAKGDVIGNQFFMLRDLLLKFCDRIKNCKLRFHIYAVDARDLPQKLQSMGVHMEYDRIEVSLAVSNLCLGPAAAISTYAPLLKPRGVNPHATLLLLFKKDLKEMEIEFGRTHPREFNELATRAWNRLREYTTVQELSNDGQDEWWNRKPTRITGASSMLFDWDDIWNRFVDEVGFMGLVEGPHGSSKDIKLKMRGLDEHKLTRPWPKRLMEGASQDEYNILCSKYRTGFERYVELVRDD
ncbi:hypothetical protein BDV95DRAFT_485026 [Massariosphaeria phaeospora]|uniref:MYND-type domain-containing protein n=1 Tax=Massariosphaeria phaeospora TaxID=100035 RepID=A0A7C8ILU2_9PLEO|nr:hypothetical protein BDV95DRAFT_485026 [Massariosphaeria phaeospora]